MTAGVLVFSSEGLPALRLTLRGVRATVPSETDVAVLSCDTPEQTAVYLTRQYLRGRIRGYLLDGGDGCAAHCGLDRALHMVGGDFVARIEDTLEPQPGWLDKAVAVMAADPRIGCLALVPPPGYQRKRGRPRTVHLVPEDCDSLDMTCFLTRREFAVPHEHELPEGPGDGVACARAGGRCAFQRALVEAGLRLAYLPGLVKALDPARLPPASPSVALEAELPVHQGATGALQRLQQEYQLGDDVLLTCMACGGTELEVLAARVRFCTAHQVAVGFWYELRCPECGELHYKDDYQFRCPE
jgi:hypothetical protein